MEKKQILLLVFVFTFSILKAQSPGGVSTNLTLWLKANTQPANLVQNASNQVSQWNSETGTFSVSQATASQQPIFGSMSAANADFNFNPFIQFTAANSTSLFNASTTPNLLGTAGTVILATNKNAPAGQGSMFTYRSNLNYRYQIKPSFRAQNGANNLGYKFELNVAANPNLTGTVFNYTESDAFLLTMSGTGLNSKARRNATDCGPSTGNSGTFFPSVGAGLSLGANGGNSEYNNHALGEVIIYDRTLTAAELNRVESYLAIKYGVSFDEIPTSPIKNNYLASNGTVIWDKTINNGYNENITGVGRDDASALLQKQSHSVNINSPVFIFNGSTAGSFPVMNDSNNTSFNTDLSFLVTGENKLNTTLDQCTNNGHISRMARTWKVQKTGSVDSVTIAFLKDSLPACTQSILLSADPNFPTTSTRVFQLITGVKYKYATVYLNNADYFSFGSDSIRNIIFDTVKTCSGTPVIFSVNPTQSCMSYAWYDAPSGGNLLGTGASFTMTSIQSNDSSFYLETSGPGNCIAGTRSTATVIRNIVTTPTAEGDSICAGQSALLTVVNPQTGFVYNWYLSPNGGSIVATGININTTNISNNSIYYLSADSSGCNSISVSVPVIIYDTETPNVNNPIFTCVNNTANLQVQNPVIGSTYNWYNAPNAGTLLGSAVSYTTGSITAPTTYYLEATNSNGCVGVRVPVNVDLFPSPTAPDVITPVVICANSSTQVQVQNPTAGYSYNWYNASSGGNILGTGITYSTGNISTNTTFYVEAVSADGCKSLIRAAVNVQINPVPVAPTTNSPVYVCINETANLSVTNANASYTYHWYDASSGGTLLTTGTTYTTNAISGNTNFYVTATNATGCKGAPATVSVQLWPLLATPVVQVTDSSINSLRFSWASVAGATGYIVSTDGINYGPPSSGATGTTHEVTGLSPDTYVTLSVIALHPLNCRTSLPGSATGHTWPEQTDVYVPGAFTPNGDGLNDVLHVLGTNIRSVHFIVYNRWGQKIFESRDQRKGWNGKFKYKEQQAMAYVYYVRAVMLDGKVIVKKGNTLLLR
jgi:gliding motility-associated-like protein